MKNSQFDTCISHLKEKKYSDITWVDLPPREKLLSSLSPYVIKGFEKYLSFDDPLKALAQFDQFRILCAIRSSPYGVVSLNSLVESL